MKKGVDQKKHKQEKARKKVTSKKRWGRPEKKRKQTSKQANKQARKQDCKARIESTNKQTKYNQETAKKTSQSKKQPDSDQLGGVVDVGPGMAHRQGS